MKRTGLWTDGREPPAQAANAASHGPLSVVATLRDPSAAPAAPLLGRGPWVGRTEPVQDAVAVRQDGHVGG